MKILISIFLLLSHTLNKEQQLNQTTIQQLTENLVLIQNKFTTLESNMEKVLTEIKNIKSNDKQSEKQMNDVVTVKTAQQKIATPVLRLKQVATKQGTDQYKEAKTFSYKLQVKDFTSKTSEIIAKQASTNSPVVQSSQYKPVQNMNKVSSNDYNQTPQTIVVQKQNQQVGQNAPQYKSVKTQQNEFTQQMKTPVVMQSQQLQQSGNTNSVQHMQQFPQPGQIEYSQEVDMDNSDVEGLEMQVQAQRFRQILETDTK